MNEEAAVFRAAQPPGKQALVRGRAYIEAVPLIERHEAEQAVPCGRLERVVDLVPCQEWAGPTEVSEGDPPASDLHQLPEPGE
jgi:hypothetical protein